MLIPKTIKILGHNYEIILQNREKVGGSTTLGTALIYKNKIFINSEQHKDQQESALLHEIIECVNGILGIGLKEEQIRGLEGGLYQALKDNKII